MTEKEKMLSQKMYDANYDSELEAERLECKTLCQEFNSTPVKELDKRKKLLKKIIGKTGENVVIGGGSVVVKDIPSNSVAVGNPCKVVREITDEDKNKSWDKE